jgi:hypothetical protein
MYAIMMMQKLKVDLCNEIVSTWQGQADSLASIADVAVIIIGFPGIPLSCLVRTDRFFIIPSHIVV